MNKPFKSFITKLGIIAQTCNHSMWEAKGGRLGIWSLFGIYKESRDPRLPWTAEWDPICKKKSFNRIWAAIFPNHSGCCVKQWKEAGGQWHLMRTVKRSPEAIRRPLQKSGVRTMAWTETVEMQEGDSCRYFFGHWLIDSEKKSNTIIWTS